MKTLKSTAIKKVKGKRIYINSYDTKKSVAQKVGVTEKTLSKWVKLFGWDEAREQVITKRLESRDPRTGSLIDNNFLFYLRLEHEELADSIEKMALKYLSPNRYT